MMVDKVSEGDRERERDRDRGRDRERDKYPLIILVHSIVCHIGKHRFRFHFPSTFELNRAKLKKSEKERIASLSDAHSDPRHVECANICVGDFCTRFFS